VTIIEHETTVCGSPVDPTVPTYTAEYDGRILYFCAADCVQGFEKDPAEFVRTHR
jgi:YHS domain-containing protein